MWNWLKNLYGTTIVFSWKLAGIPLFTITKQAADKYNVFILFIPLLRVRKNKVVFGLNILLLAWIFDVFENFHRAITDNFARFYYRSHQLVEIMYSDTVKGVSLFRKNIYSVRKVTPFKFTNSLFKG